MSLLSQIPKPSFIFDPSQANESRDALTQVRRIADQSGGGFSRPPADPNFPLVPNKYVQNKAGILEGIIPNVPAVEFDGAFNKGYLAESSATNLFLNSDSPATQGISTTAQNYTLSFFGEGEIVLSGTATGTLTGVVGERVSLTVTATAGTLTLTVTDTDKVQFETGSVATSYIPTTGSTATRSADSLVFTGAQDLIGQTSGVMLLDFAALPVSFIASAFNRYFEIGSGDNLMQVRLRGDGNTGIQVHFRGNANSAFYNNSALDGELKMAISYASSELKTYVNGSLIDTRSITHWSSPRTTLAIGCDTSGGNAIPKAFFKSAYLWNNADWASDSLIETLTRI